MMRNKSFAVFIVSHGRADNVMTYRTLKHSGYTGRTYIIIDNEDDQREEYVKRFGKGNVIVFDKKAWKEKTDSMDNLPERNVVVYARNACFQIARDLGLRFFLVLDDDYSQLVHRFRDNVFISSVPTKKIDTIFDIYVDFLNTTPCKTISFAQGGDYIGGIQGEAKKVFMKRKSMNSFFCDTEKPFMFMGRINEDVNAYVTYGKRGDLFFQPNVFMLNQAATQQNRGGLTDAYLRFGTYAKSFYTILDNPSCVKITMMGETNRRLHHRITWKLAVPRILNEKWRKA